MNLILVLLFITCTAFFVAAEYSVIRSRMSLIEQLIAEGNKKAVAVKQIVSRLDEYLSACQLGNTLTNLALGWLGESTFEKLLQPVFRLLHIPSGMEPVLSFIVAFLLLTYLEVVVGELVPKIFAIQKAEPLALLLARPLTIFFKITFPFSWLLNRSALFVTGLFGLKGISPEQANRSEAELRLILSEGYKSGIINPSEFRYVTNIFELDDVAVKGIMVPRMDICFASLQHSIQDFINSTEGATFDLYPVTLEEDKDRIVGHVSIKEILTDYIRRGTDPGQSIEPYVKPVIQVIETISAQELLLKMQKDHVQIAILLDEYGGTSGLITIKDIIRKIVGENERDTEGLPMVEKISEGRYYLSAKLLLKDVNRLLKTELEDEGIHTLGGWLLAQKYDIHEGDCVSIGKYDFVVTDMENKQIKRAEAIMRGKEGESRGTG